MADKPKIKYSDHPSIVLISGKPKLRIFEDFAVEETLPKFKIKVQVKNPQLYDEVASLHPEDGSLRPDTTVGEAVSDVNAGGRPIDNRVESRDYYELQKILVGEGFKYSSRETAAWDREQYIRNKLRAIRNTYAEAEIYPDSKTFVPVEGKAPRNKTFSEWWYDTFSKPKADKQPPPPAEPPLPPPDYSIEEAFERIKTMLIVPSSELMEKHKRIIDTAIKQLKDVGQLAKAEEFDKHAFTLANELTLAQDKRFAKYLTEEQVVQLMLKSEKGINIEFLRYYSEIIPRSVIDKKLEADKLMVFDNYAVIHYDTSVTKFKQIIEKEEARKDRERRRDPILVGLIQGSHKLYYIADWVTKDDDLTLEKVEELLGIKTPMLSAFDKDVKIQEENAFLTDETIRHMNELVRQVDAVAAAIDNNSTL